MIEKIGDTLISSGRERGKREPYHTDYLEYFGHLAQSRNLLLANRQKILSAGGYLRYFDHFIVG